MATQIFKTYLDFLNREKALEDITRCAEEEAKLKELPGPTELRP